jgi:hypothetical protein
VLGGILVLLLFEASILNAAGSNVNPEVTLAPNPSTYRTTADTFGCPAGFVGKFTFTAVLANRATSPPIPDLSIHVVTLTNGNVILDPQTNAVLGGVGA